MIFKVGDKVLFKKEKQSGIIIKVNSLYKVVVETIDGFDIIVSVNDLARVEADTDKSNSYGEVVLFQQDKVTSPKLKTKQQRSQSVLKVDLHIELLIDNYQYISNFEIVQIQLDECQKNVEKALNSSYQKLIIIHGVGTGVLKNKVHNLLNNYKLRYYLSKDGGATEVML